jgi:hypothetical protein
LRKSADGVRAKRANNAAQRPRAIANECFVSKDTEKFYRLVGELDRSLIQGVGDGFWSARPIFAEMDRSFLNGWAACRLKEIRDDRDFLVFRDRNSLTINITKAYAISLTTIDHPPADLYLYPQHYMARNVGRVPLKVRRYRCDRPIRNEVYDPDVRLELRDEFELIPGETVERNGCGDVLDWQSEGTEGFLLRLHSESLGHYEWAFDKATLAPKGVTVLDVNSSQVATAMQMLTALEIPVHKEFIETGLASPYFHVRWEALKMINRVAPEMVRETLERLTSDPHPTIRRAAEKTIAVNAANQRTGS